jgi:hypothetical protein
VYLDDQAEGELSGAPGYQPGETVMVKRADWHADMMRLGFYRPLLRHFISFECRHDIAVAIMERIDRLPAYRRRLVHVYGAKGAPRLPEWHDRKAALALLKRSERHCLPPTVRNPCP